MPAKYKVAVDAWTYLELGKKPEKTKLQCETVFADVQQALREGKPFGIVFQLISSMVIVLIAVLQTPRVAE